MALGFWLIYAAQSSVHIEVCAGDGNNVDEPAYKQDGGFISFQCPKIHPNVQGRCSVILLFARG